MANDDQIRIRIGLDGDEEVKRRFDAIKDVAKKGSDEIKRSFETVSTGPGLSKAIDVEKDLERSRLGAERFRETLHTLHPVLDEAGLGFGNLGSFARLAFSGLGSLGTAIIGSIIVGLAKLGDEAITVKKRLGDLLQNPAGGKSLFEDLEKQAQQLGADTAGLAPSLENLLALRNKINATGVVSHPPGANPENITGDLSNENILAAQKALFESLKIGKTPTEEATKALQDFTAALGKTGQLSAESVESLAKTSFGAANTLAQSLQRGFSNYQDLLKSLNAGTKFSAEEIIRDLARIGPGVHTAFEQSKGDSETFGDSLDNLKAKAKELLKVLEGPGVAVPVLNEVSKILEQDRRDIEAFIALYQRLVKLLGEGSAALQNSPLGDLADKLSRVLGLSGKSPNQRVSEEFGAIGKPSDKPVSPDALAARRAALDETGKPTVPGIVKAQPTTEEIAGVAEQRRLSREEGSTLIPSSGDQAEPLFNGKFKGDEFTPITGGPSRPFDFSKDQNYQPPDRAPDRMYENINRLRSEPIPGNPEDIKIRPVPDDQRSEGQSTEQLASLGDGLRSFIETVSSSLNRASPAKDLDQSGQQQPGGGIRGESESDSSSKDVADLGDKAGDAASGLDSFIAALANAVSEIRSKPTDENTPVAHAYRGGYVRRFAGGGAIGPSPKENFMVIL